MEIQLRFKSVLVILLLACISLVLVLPQKNTVEDPLSGTWTGDWGPTPSHRNVVTVSLKWDGTTLSGAINPGPHALQFTNASFDTRKRLVHLEVEVLLGGREVRYVIDGFIEGDTLIGTWYNEDNKGNFRLRRK